MSPKLLYSVASLVLLTSCGVTERPTKDARRLPGSSSSAPRYDVTCIDEANCKRSMRHQCPQGYQVQGMDRETENAKREDPPSLQQPSKPEMNRVPNWQMTTIRYVFSCL